MKHSIERPHTSQDLEYEKESEMRCAEARYLEANDEYNKYLDYYEHVLKAQHTDIVCCLSPNERFHYYGEYLGYKIVSIHKDNIERPAGLRPVKVICAGYSFNYALDYPKLFKYPKFTGLTAAYKCNMITRDDLYNIGCIIDPDFQERNDKIQEYWHSLKPYHSFVYKFFETPEYSNALMGKELVEGLEIHRAYELRESLDAAINMQIDKEKPIEPAIEYAAECCEFVKNMEALQTGHKK